MTRSPAKALGSATVAIALWTGMGPVFAAATPLPEIRLSSANGVPRCVTPERLMTFLQTRNSNLDPRFKDIARHYKSHGQAWNVRWDYAFFQMALETNFLTYRRPDGRMGDVNPAQNNFAGIGTTGGGVPGDSFPDVRTGVLAQIQHLVAYSGEKLAQPLAPRTQLKQDDIVTASRKLARPVRFSDLARRWAVDPKYGSSIAFVANEFMTRHCPKGEDKPEIMAAKPAASPSRADAGAAIKPAKTVKSPSLVKPAKAAPQLTKPVTAPPIVQTAALAGAQPADAAAVAPLAQSEASAETAAARGRCTIRSASYGGRKTVLIRHDHASGTDLTALTVLDGFEKSMVANFMKTRAPGGTEVGAFADAATALDSARKLCPAT